MTYRHDTADTARPVVLFTNGAENQIHAIGEFRGAYDQPTVIVEINGQQRAWAASLAREATPDEAEAYWRERALKAEEQRDRALVQTERAIEQSQRALDLLGPKP